MRFLLKPLLLLLAVLCLTAESMAQCAMCRATVESGAAENAESVAAGLNMGILFLFSMPYISAVVIIYLWKKNAKRFAV